MIFSTEPTMIDVEEEMAFLRMEYFAHAETYIAGDKAGKLCPVCIGRGYLI